MSLGLFNSVPTGAIEALFDGENKPWFKRADLGRYLGIAKVKNSMHIPSHFMCKKQDMEGDCCTVPLGRGKNPHDVFVNLDGAIYIATNSKKEKAAALISWLVKKGVEKLQEDHQKATEERDTRIQAIEYENVGLQGEIQNARRTIN